MAQCDLELWMATGNQVGVTLDAWQNDAHFISQRDMEGNVTECAPCVTKPSNHAGIVVPGRWGEECPETGEWRIC